MFTDMMKEMVKLFSVLLLLSLAGCVTREDGTSINQSEPMTIHTGIALDSRLVTLDSLLVFFYDDPFGPDSTRYTRFYKLYGTSADSAIALLQANMAHSFEEDTLRRCRSEGKIYAYNQGKVQQTIYFNTQQGSCYQLYFIQTARYYYSEPDAALVAWLRSIRPFVARP